MATFYNQATISYNGIVRASNVAQGELIGEIEVDKTAVNNTYKEGDGVAYVINIVNSGTTDYTGVSITDNLGAFTPEGSFTPLTPLTYTPDSVAYYRNGVLQTAPGVTAGPPLVISGIDVPAGGNAIIAYEATVNNTAPLEAGSTILNTAQVSGPFNTVQAQEEITAEDYVNLSISKTVSPDEVTDNDRVTYTFVIQNTGNAEAGAGAGIQIADTFDPPLSDLVVTLDDTTLTEGTDYTYTSPNFATVAGRITVPAATFTRADDGTVTSEPGVAVLKVTGTV